MLRIEKILVPVDLPQNDNRATTYAVSLAGKFGAEIHVLHVAQPEVRGQSSSTRGLRPVRAPHIADDLDLPEVPAEVRITRVEVEDTSPSTAIVDYARDQEIDLIVMGGRSRRGLHLHHLGGVAGPVVRYAPCSVLTVRDRLPRRNIPRILVPVDLSEISRTPLAVARHLASRYGSEIDLLMVLEHLVYPTSYGVLDLPRLEDELQEAWEGKLRDFWVTTDGPEVPHRVHVRTGAPGPEIINFSLQRSSDLIVIGTHGRTGIRRLVMGSVAEKVVYRALTATLTVKSFGRPLPDPEAADAGTVKPLPEPEEVRSRIRRAFERAARRDADAIEVQTSGGEVSLCGRVHSLAERDEAERAARAAPGVSHVRNDLAVGSATSLSLELAEL